MRVNEVLVIPKLANFYRIDAGRWKAQSWLVAKTLTIKNLLDCVCDASS